MSRSIKLEGIFWPSDLLVPLPLTDLIYKLIDLLQWNKVDSVRPDHYIMSTHIKLLNFMSSISSSQGNLSPFSLRNSLNHLASRLKKQTYSLQFCKASSILWFLSMDFKPQGRILSYLNLASRFCMDAEYLLVQQMKVEHNNRFKF